MRAIIRRRVIFASLLIFPTACIAKGGGHGGGKGAAHSSARRSRRSPSSGHSSEDCSDENKSWFSRSFWSSCKATEKGNAEP